MGRMRRTVAAHLELGLTGRTTLVFSVAAAARYPLERETVRATVNGVPVTPRELSDRHGAQLHVLDAEGSAAALDYEAVVAGPAAPDPGHEVDLLTYLRPSRYCESDTLGPTAASEFGGLTGQPLLKAVGQWVSDQLVYVTGSSRSTDGAVNTLLARQGVCRDFAHLVTALLRSLNVPVRIAAVYAPGLSPMEFHAVAEAYIDDAWYVVDATHLAPRQSLVRIATGRDAADTAFLTNFSATTVLRGVEVTAVAEEFDTETDPQTLVQLQ